MQVNEGYCCSVVVLDKFLGTLVIHTTIAKGHKNVIADCRYAEYMPSLVRGIAASWCIVPHCLHLHVLCRCRMKTHLQYKYRAIVLLEVS